MQADCAFLGSARRSIRASSLAVDRVDATPDGLKQRIESLARRLPKLESNLELGPSRHLQQVQGISRTAVQRIEEGTSPTARRAGGAGGGRARVDSPPSSFPMPLPPSLHSDLHHVLANNKPPVLTSDHTTVANRLPQRVLPVEVKGLQPFDTTHGASFKDLFVAPSKPIRPKQNGAIAGALQSDPHIIDGTTASRSFVKPLVAVRRREPIKPVGSLSLLEAEWSGPSATSTYKSAYTAWTGLQRRKPILPRVGKSPLDEEGEMVGGGGGGYALARSTSDSAFNRYDPQFVPRREPIYPKAANPFKQVEAPPVLLQSTSHSMFHSPAPFLQGVREKVGAGFNDPRRRPPVSSMSDLMRPDLGVEEDDDEGGALPRRQQQQQRGWVERPDVQGWSTDGRKMMIGLQQQQQQQQQQQSSGSKGMNEAEIAAWVRYGGDRGKATAVKHH